MTSHKYIMENFFVFSEKQEKLSIVWTGEVIYKFPALEVKNLEPGFAGTCSPLETLPQSWHWCFLWRSNTGWSPVYPILSLSTVLCGPRWHLGYKKKKKKKKSIH